jgi:hypothetical protein
MDQVAEPVPPDRKKIVELPVKLLCIPGPVQHEGIALDRIQVYKSPVTAVSAVVPIVTHHEQRIFRYNYGPVIIAGRGGIYIRITVNAIAIVKELSVDKHLFVFYLYPVPLYTDNPFYVILFRVAGILEDHNISSGRLLDWNENTAGKRVPDAVDEFVDQDMIPDQQGRDHRTGRYFEGLDNKGPDEEGKKQGNENGLYILSQYRFLFFRGHN